MKKLAILTLLFSTFSIHGCAGYLNAWTNDPFQRHKIKGSTVYTMTGDRRTAIVNDKNSNMRYCAESLPDGISALASSSTANIKAEGLKGGAGGGLDFSDKNAVSLMQTFQRTEIAELSRQLGWSTCLAWMQGAISDAQYHAILKDIVTGSIEVMKTRASQAQLAPALPQPVIAEKVKSDVNAPPKAAP